METSFGAYLADYSVLFFKWQGNLQQAADKSRHVFVFLVY